MEKLPLDGKIIKMCLAVPMKIVEIKGLDAVAELQGVRRRVRLDLVEDCRVGDYVLIHAGFAIEKLDEEEAKKSLQTWEEFLKAQE